jgi:hypothetical protein
LGLPLNHPSVKRKCYVSQPVAVEHYINVYFDASGSRAFPT